MNLQINNWEDQSLSVEIKELQKEARKYLADSKSENTKRAYTSDWKLFVDWCEKKHLESLPAKPETVTLYITYLGKKHKASSIKRKITAISQRHKTAGYPSPTNSVLVKGVWDGLLRKIGRREEGKEALWLQDLRRIVETLPRDRLIGTRNRALLVMGWAGAMRRSEIVFLNVEDLRFTRDGLLVLLRKSKTDQSGEGQEIALPYGSNPLTCPVRAMQDWLEASGISSGAIFRGIDRHGNIKERLTPQSVRLIVKRCCEKVGLAPDKYGAHSLRSGFCSTAARAGKTEHQIMRQTRHRKADSLQRYIKYGTLFEDNPASGIGL